MSKKLQTDPAKLQAALGDPGKSTLGIITAMRPPFLAVIHDARIAHEQREILAEGVYLLRAQLETNCHCAFCNQVRDFLALAATYLSED